MISFTLTKSGCLTSSSTKNNFSSSWGIVVPHFYGRYITSFRKHYIQEVFPMTTESMSIHRALVELKTIDSRIIKKIDSAKFCVAAKAKATKLGAITVD